MTTSLSSSLLSLRYRLRKPNGSAIVIEFSCADLASRSAPRVLDLLDRIETVTGLNAFTSCVFVFVLLFLSWRISFVVSREADHGRAVRSSLTFLSNRHRTTDRTDGHSVANERTEYAFTLSPPAFVLHTTRTFHCRPPTDLPTGRTDGTARPSLHRFTHELTPTHTRTIHPLFNYSVYCFILVRHGQPPRPAQFTSANQLLSSAIPSMEFLILEVAATSPYASLSDYPPRAGTASSSVVTSSSEALIQPPASESTIQEHLSKLHLDPKHTSSASHSNVHNAGGSASQGHQANTMEAQVRLFSLRSLSPSNIHCSHPPPSFLSHTPTHIYTNTYTLRCLSLTPQLFNLQSMCVMLLLRVLYLEKFSFGESHKITVLNHTHTHTHMYTLMYILCWRICSATLFIGSYLIDAGQG